MDDLFKLMKGDPSAWTKGELIGNYNPIKEKLGRVPTHTEMRR